MCLIAVAAKPEVLSPQVLADALSANPHGFGFMAVREGHLASERFGQMTSPKQYNRDFLEKLDEWRNAADGQVVVHLRQRTHGLADDSMAHPFPLDTGKVRGLLMHNGIFQSGFLHSLYEGVLKHRPDAGAFPEEARIGSLSDTAIYVKLLEMARLDAEELSTVFGQSVRLAPMNRLVFWDEDKDAPDIYNMESGVTSPDGALWYSNDWYFHGPVSDVWAA